MTEFDPISLEIIWNRLISIADESALALVRTSFSNVVRESNDFACAILDANGDSVAENSIGIPSFVGIMPRTMKHFLAVMPIESWRPGDVALTNDPWLATGHLLDVTTASPIFHQGRLVAFFVAVAHMVDIGGLGFTADGRSVFEEGLRIPPMWLQKEGQPNDDLLKVVRANVRVPEEVVRDLLARATTGLVCARRLGEFLTEQQLADLSAVSRTLQERAELSMRQAIEKIPDGTYRHEAVSDGYENPIVVKAAVTVRGSDILVDYEGTSPESDRALNSVMGYTWAYTAYPIKCALDPFTPKNEGSYKPIAVVAPEGSILNPRFPAPVTARAQVAHYLTQAVFGALARVVPEQVMAECGSAPSFMTTFTGHDADRRPFSTTLFAAGGMGGRKGLDGLSCTAYPTNTIFGSLEAIECAGPLRFRWQRLRPDSGGPGRHRGGLGQYIGVEVESPDPSILSLAVDRVRHPARGLDGGLPGAPSVLYVNDESRPLRQKASNRIEPGDVMNFFYPGGGGYGDPRDRDRAAVLRDVRNGVVSREAAASFYGVVPTEGEIGDES